MQKKTSNKERYYSCFKRACSKQVMLPIYGIVVESPLVLDEEGKNIHEKNLSQHDFKTN